MTGRYTKFIHLNGLPLGVSLSEHASQSNNLINMRVALVALALVAVAAMLPSCIASSSSYYPNRHLPDSNTTVRWLVRNLCISVGCLHV